MASQCPKDYISHNANTMLAQQQHPALIQDASAIGTCIPNGMTRDTQLVLPMQVTMSPISNTDVGSASIPTEM